MSGFGAIGELAIGEVESSGGGGGGGGGSGATAAQIWAYEITPGVTAGAMLLALYRLHGLDVAAPLTVTPTSRTAGTIAQTITTAGSDVTVTRTA